MCCAGATTQNAVNYLRKGVLQNIGAKTQDEDEDLNNFSTTETPERLGKPI
jgi:hypothetical protein